MKNVKKIWLTILVIFFTINPLWPQEDQRYFLGKEEKLQIIVHVLGEVKKPGEYIVSDNTNVVELISKAGGATQYSNMNKVSITRNKYLPTANDTLLNLNIDHEKSVIYFDIDDYLTEVDNDLPPILKPGDIIYVPKNKWSTWTTVAGVMRDLAVVASAYFLYLRAVKD